MADLKPPTSTTPSIATSTAPHMESPLPDRHYNITRLSDADLAIVCHAIGASSSVESQALLHPTSKMYPPKGIPDGLYRDVIRARVNCQYSYYVSAALVNTSMVFQLLLGAALTALGSRANGQELAITLLAAANTVIAGLLALLHNSGLPDRFQKDWNEYDEVESFLKELMETGIVKRGMTREDVIENCFAKFRRAKACVYNNRPSTYTASSESGTDSPPQQVAPHLA
ncbi:hypothetical protein LSUB1_G001236 [Lachnellula subtilissima]|uniref:SMODS and SLOG-associating 2TM effector domain-containing protein n=1 Tax=Lachnellula subtilissima TaxID=602034 RepID=A0A8H8UGB7_9HELO|nr:hypothetical protein LSUB1_G001236 [Lachnellula subtilissima]